MTLPTSPSGFFVSHLIPDRSVARVLARVVAGQLTREFSVAGTDNPGQRVVACHPWRGAFPVETVCDACMAASGAPLAELDDDQECGCIVGQRPVWMESGLVTGGYHQGIEFAQLYPGGAEQALCLIACMRQGLGFGPLNVLLREIAGLPLALERDEDDNVLCPVNVAVSPCPEIGRLSIYVQDASTLRSYLHFYAHDPEFVLRMAAIVVTPGGLGSKQEVGFEKTGLRGYVHHTGPIESWIALANTAAARLNNPASILSALADGMLCVSARPWDVAPALRPIARAAVLEIPAGEDDGPGPHVYLSAASHGDPIAIQQMARGMWLEIDLPKPKGRWDWLNFTGSGLLRDDGHQIAVEGHAPSAWAGLMAAADATVPYNQARADAIRLRHAEDRLAFIGKQLEKLDAERARLDADRTNLVAEREALLARRASSAA